MSIQPIAATAGFARRRHNRYSATTLSGERRHGPRECAGRTFTLFRCDGGLRPSSPKPLLGDPERERHHGPRECAGRTFTLFRRDGGLCPSSPQPLLGDHF
jgi:hypothetical protein